MTISGRTCLAVAVLGALAGCVGPAGPGTRLQPDSKKGLAVLSLDQPERFRELIWSYRRVGTDERRKISTADIAIDRVDMKPIYAGGALVFALLDDEGDYEFYAWTQPRAAPGLSYYHSTEPFSVLFHVTRGKATYVGDLEMVVQESFGRLKYHLEIHDRRDQDIPAFLQAYLNVREGDVLVGLMSMDGSLGAPQPYLPAPAPAPAAPNEN